jgi:hypothetical protein
MTILVLTTLENVPDCKNNACGKRPHHRVSVAFGGCIDALIDALGLARLIDGEAADGLGLAALMLGLSDTLGLSEMLRLRL